jgi:hypothetical protein
MPDHVIAHIDALGAAAAAEASVYLDETNLDTDYKPLNDVSANSPDKPLDSDFLPIMAAERDRIRVDRQRHVPGVNTGVAGRFNNDDDNGSNDSDIHVGQGENDEDKTNQNEALQNSPFALVDNDSDDEADDDDDVEDDVAGDRFASGHNGVDRGNKEFENGTIKPVEDNNDDSTLPMVLMRPLTAILMVIATWMMMMITLLLMPRLTTGVRKMTVTVPHSKTE